MPTDVRAARDRATLERGTAVVAVDLLTTGERHADALLLRLHDELRRVSGGEVIGATHWAEAAGRRHVVLTAEAAGTAPAELIAAVDRAAAAEGAGTPAAFAVDGVLIGDPGLADALDAASTAHRGRRSGRVTVFPGADAVPAEVTVRLLCSMTPITRVLQLAEGDADPDAVIVTRGHLRPRWQDGELVLHVQPAAGGRLVPFEVPDPTPCCAAHG